MTRKKPTPQNRGGTGGKSKTPPVGRRFAKGHSGNPGGRPKGLVSAIRDQTKDGQELVTFMLKVFRGKLAGAKLKDRMDAATWLADRGFGRPVQALEHSGKDGQPLISVDVLQALVADADAAA